MLLCPGIAWYVNTILMKIEFEFIGPDYQYATSNYILPMNTWLYLGGVYDYQTGKLISSFWLVKKLYRFDQKQLDSTIY
jgi:hypothetical protein